MTGLHVEREIIVRRTRPALVIGLTALLAAMLAAPAGAKGGPPADVPRGGTGQPAYEIDWDQVEDEADEVEAATGVATMTGEIAGAAWLAQVPPNWNGDVLVYAHGYRGEGTRLTVDAPPVYQHLTATGTAWIASSYRRNSYDPGIGVMDTKNATEMFTAYLEEEHGAVGDVVLAGFSMGGHVTVAAIEKFPDLYDGALPACGVLGDVELFDYFLDYSTAAAALAGVPLSLPDEAFLEDEVPAIRSALSFAPDDFEVPVPGGTRTRNVWAASGSPLSGFNALTPAGVRLKDMVEIGSGGERGAIYDVAWDYWHLGASPTGDFFFDLVEGDGTIAGRNGIVSQNSDTLYGEEYGPAFADLDDSIARLSAAKWVRNSQGQTPAPIVNGTPQIPVLTIHTLGDLFVPIEMEQIYAAEVAANGLSHNLVQRTIRDVGHCTFTASEVIQSYTDIFSWVKTGVAPAGEDLSRLTTDPLAWVAMGCAWTITDGTQSSESVRAFPCS